MVDVPLSTWHIGTTTSAQQGLYEYDAVSRLRDSQLGDARVSDIGNYIKLGQLWEAFGAVARPVLLIDEIDKADLEFPNDLLLELDLMRFHVDETGARCSPPNGRSSSSPRTTRRSCRTRFFAAASFTISAFPITRQCQDRRVHFPDVDDRVVDIGAARVLRRARDAAAAEEAVDIGADRLAEAFAQRGRHRRDAARARPEEDHSAAARRPSQETEQDVHLFENLRF